MDRPAKPTSNKVKVRALKLLRGMAESPRDRSRSDHWAVRRPRHSAPYNRPIATAARSAAWATVFARQVEAHFMACRARFRRSFRESWSRDCSRIGAWASSGRLPASGSVPVAARHGLIPVGGPWRNLAQHPSLTHWPPRFAPKAHFRVGRLFQPPKNPRSWL